MLQYEIPKITDLNRSNPDYMSQLEAGLRKIDVIRDVQVHERVEALRVFPSRVVDIAKQRGIEAKLVPNGRRYDYTDHARAGTAFTLDGNLLLLSSSGNGYIENRRLGDDVISEYERLKLQEEWKLKDRERELEVARRDFEKELHGFTKVNTINNNGEYENVVYYLVTGDDNVFRLYVNAKALYFQERTDVKIHDFKKMDELRGSFFSESNIDRLRAEAEKLKTHVHVVSTPSTYFGPLELSSYVLMSLEVPFYVGRIFDDALKGKPKGEEGVLKRVVEDIGVLTGNGSKTVPQISKWRLWWNRH